MSENSHIDKIFKEGLGERNFSNVDAMWDRMETELDKEKDKKRKPIIFLMVVVTLVVTGLWGVQHFRHSIATDTSIITADKSNTNSPNNETGNKSQVQSDNVAVIKSNNKVVDNTTSLIVTANHVQQPNVVGAINKQLVVNSSSKFEEENNFQTPTIPELTELKDHSFEKMTTTASLLALPQWNKNAVDILPVFEKALNTSSVLKPIKRKILPVPGKFTFEAVGGGDLIRLNRKAGFYAGLRVNRKLENGTLVSAGVNFASHIIRDKYRIKTKPAEQRTSDARINRISSVRFPVYLQRQMGTGRLSMMVGLVPTYITKAEVYNVPNSYIGDPDPFRKFDLDDINRFNLLFGAGLRYSASKWVSIELSGSYGLTGMVKDGYKNLSRVNDNFKSIQLGAAFRLK